MTDTTQKPQILVGLVAPARSGKDTVAGMLLEHWHNAGHAASCQAFADPLREMIQAFLLASGVPKLARYMFEDKETTIPELGVSYRHLAQTLGTDWAHAHLGRDVWIRSMQSRLAARPQLECERIVVTDVRFPLEADWVREQGGVLWRIERPGATPVRAHVSEQQIRSIQTDRVIFNDGTLTDLRQAIGLELARLHYERGIAH